MQTKLKAYLFTNELNGDLVVLHANDADDALAKLYAMNQSVSHWTIRNVCECGRVQFAKYCCKDCFDVRFE